VTVQPPVPGVYPAIVTEDKFYAANSRLQSETRHKRTNPSAHNRNLFTGLAKCSECGNSMLLSGGDRLLCGGATRALAGGCRHAHSVLYEPFKKSFLAFLADSDLVREHLSTKQSGPSKLDELQTSLVDTEKLVAKLTVLICGDDDPPKTLYNRLKQEEARALKFRREIETETMRLKGETPGLVAYLEFRETFAAKVEDSEYRERVRKLLPSIIERIDVQPLLRKVHGIKVWDYEVTLKGSKVKIPASVCSDGSCIFRSLRPAGVEVPGEMHGRELAAA
jgi:hypothetical protein